LAARNTSTGIVIGLLVSPMTERAMSAMPYLGSVLQGEAINLPASTAMNDYAFLAGLAKGSEEHEAAVVGKVLSLHFFLFSWRVWQRDVDEERERERRVSVMSALTPCRLRSITLFGG